MTLNGITRIVVLLCIFSSVALGQDEETKTDVDKCNGPPPRFRNMSSCCEMPNLIEESVLEECGIPLELGVRFWLHGPHHHRRGHGKFHHHGPHGEHGGPGHGHHGPHGHGWMDHGPHDGPGSEHGPHDGPGSEHGGPHGHGSMENGPPTEQGNDRPGAGEGPVTASTLDAEWPSDGEESWVGHIDERSGSQLRRARRYPAPHHHGHHRHPGPPPCDKELCIFRKLSLLGESEKVDIDAFTAWLDQLETGDLAWGGTKDAVVTDGIANNALSHRPFGVCEPLHLLVHTTGHLFKHCPEDKWKADENCSALKTYMNDCN